MKLSIDKLEEMQACASGLDQFYRVFGDKTVNITEAALVRYLRASTNIHVGVVDLYWLMSEVLPRVLFHEEYLPYEFNVQRGLYYEKYTVPQARRMLARKAMECLNKSEGKK